MTKEIVLNNNDLLVMNLVHYFITVKNYNPVILHGITDEIWLENMDSDYKIVRIVSHYIHNDEQLSFDRFKLDRISKNLKKQLKVLVHKFQALHHVLLNILIRLLLILII